MQTIGTLLNPKNGITPHVRNLFIVNGCWEKEECWKNGVIIDPMLQLVVSAFPQDRLRALVGDDEIVLDTTLLVCLLQHQSRSLGLIRKHVELPELQGLEVLRCPGAHLLLTALQPGCNLTKLIFEQANAHIRTDQDQQAIERLLNSFSGLRVLSLSLYDRIVDVSCIVHHGSSLRQLGIHCYSTCLSVDDLEELLQSSPHLEGLGVDFCKVRLGEVEHAISNFKLAQMHGEVHAASELETYLVSNSLHHSCISADTNNDASDCHLSPPHTEMRSHLYPSRY